MKKLTHLYIVAFLALTLGLMLSCAKKDDGGSSTTSTTSDNDTTTTEDTNTTTDTTAPVIAEVTFVTTPNNDTTPDYTFSSNEAGTITYGGSCSSSTTSATSGNNTITLVSLSERTYSDCTITVTDSAGNVSNTLTITSFIVDTTAATLVEVTAVTTLTNDPTPDYTFSSSEAGAITYGGSCSSSTTSATTDNNTITLVSLSDDTYSDCTITVTDNASNGVTLNMSSFVIDTTAPTVYSISPTDNQSSVSITDNITVTFSEAMDITYVTTNTDNTSCSGTLRVSSDNFSNCVQMASAPASSNSDKTFTLDPSDNLTVLTTYLTRVTTGVKDAAGNAMGSQYETSSGFTVPDTTAPANPGIIINGGDNVAYSDNVTLSLSAKDAVGVTGYYASENSTVSTSGWSIVDSATTFSDNVSFTLSSANDNKTVYVWFKDAAGNVSSSASDNITKSPPTVIISRTGQDQNTGNSYTTNNLEWQIATAAKNDGLSNGLNWYYNAKLYWDDAVSYCSNLELAGKTDWRLPTKFELISLIEDQNPGPKIDSRLYATTPSSTVPPSNPWSEYWSSTTQQSNNVYAYYVDFGIGQEWYLKKTGVLPLFVRCVRP